MGVEKVAGFGKVVGFRKVAWLWGWGFLFLRVLAGGRVRTYNSKRKCDK